MAEIFMKRKFEQLKLKILLPPSGGCFTYLLLLILLWRGADLQKSDGALLTKEINVALRGIANQSSLYESIGAASKANDGSLEANYALGQCSHTNYDYEPWWTVDLLDTYQVSFVAITNRVDYAPQRLNGAVIEVWGAWFSLRNRCATIVSIGSGETRFFPCRGIEGQYVAVIIPGRYEYLTLCEVQIFTLPLPGTNVALIGTATQSSTYESFSMASKAIDGSLTSNYQRRECASTSYEFQPWWAVDLLDTYPVSFVAITNRGNTASERINGAEIQIWDTWFHIHSRCATITSLGAGETGFFPCAGAEGRYVAVTLPVRFQLLTLCEVQVFTLQPPPQRNVLRVVFVSADANALETPESRDLVLRQVQIQIETRFSVGTYNLTWEGYRIEKKDLSIKEETRSPGCLNV